MSTADQLEVVNRKLSSGGGGGAEAVALAEGGLVQGWMKARRLLVIVRSSTSHAVFVFHAKSLPLGDETDIEVESVLPIKHDFRYSRLRMPAPARALLRFSSLLSQVRNRLRRRSSCQTGLQEPALV